MTTSITATAMVTFDAGGSSSEHLSAQIDDRANGLNAGKTSFKPGDSPAFLVWCSVPANLAVEAAGGNVHPAGAAITSHNQDVADYLQPGDAEIEIQISPPARGLPTMVFELGSSGITTVAGTVLRNGSIGSVILRRTVNPISPPPGQWLVGNLTWSAEAVAYKITTPQTAKRAILLASAKVDP